MNHNRAKHAHARRHIGLATTGRFLAGAWVIVLGTLDGGATAIGQETAELVEARKIWDRAPHNAFTDLVRYRGKWFCVFREGQDHVSPDGALRVIVSEDGAKWHSAALLQSRNSDLRDAKIVITPDGRLMLGGAAALHPPAEIKHQSMVWYSSDGYTWSDAIEVGDPNFWLWRHTWHEGTVYSIGYCTTDERLTRLYSSRDGTHYQPHVANLFDRGYPNETSLLFLDDGTCLWWNKKGDALLAPR